MPGLPWTTFRAALAPLGLLFSLTACGTPPAEIEDIEVRDGYQALELLMDGNARFMAGEPRHSHESLARRARLAGGQHPFAIILGCADSRVAPELLFDAGLGDLFVIRVAGNIVSDEEAGSMEYAVGHLDVPLIMVMGHETCGSVTAAVQAPGEDSMPELDHLLARVRPALAGIDPSLPEDERIHLGVEANVRQSVEQIVEIARRVGPAEGGVLIVGAVYELDTGRVRLVTEPVFKGSPEAR